MNAFLPPSSTAPTDPMAGSRHRPPRPLVQAATSCTMPAAVSAQPQSFSSEGDLSKAHTRAHTPRCGRALRGAVSQGTGGRTTGLLGWQPCCPAGQGSRGRGRGSLAGRGCLGAPLDVTDTVLDVSLAPALHLCRAQGSTRATLSPRALRADTWHPCLCLCWRCPWSPAGCRPPPPPILEAGGRCDPAAVGPAESGEERRGQVSQVSRDQSQGVGSEPGVLAWTRPERRPRRSRSRGQRKPAPAA